MENEDKGQMLLMHLESCIELNRIVINPDLDENYPIYIQNFRDTFDLCHSAGLLNETEKCHHVYAPWHLEEELRRTGESLWGHDTSGVEKTHSTYQAFQKEHGFECTKTIGITSGCSKNNIIIIYHNCVRDNKI